MAKTMKKRPKNPGRHARTKGHSFERAVAVLLRPVFPNARRHLEYHARDANGVDLDHTGRFKIQCKKLKKYAGLNRIKEIKYADWSNEIPVLVTAGDNQMPLAALPLDALIELLLQVPQSTLS